MPALPLLLFPTPTQGERNNRNRFVPPPISFPSQRRQSERITPKFDALSSAYEARRVAIQRATPGDSPELVLVLETIGGVDRLENAIRKVPGLEWLLEWDEENVQPDADFHYSKQGDRADLLDGRLYLVASNKAAVDQLISLWGQYNADPDVQFARGFAPFKHVFKQLKDVRYWSAQDRIQNDVKAFWQDCLDAQQTSIKFEIEAWCYASQDKNTKAATELTGLVAALGGSVLQRTLLTEIAYHGFLVELPAPAIQQILAGQVPDLALSDRIMFFRPRSQAITWPAEEGELTEHGNVTGAASGAPVIALLDGLPLQNHALLSGRLVVDDPDSWETTYEAKDRVHGTAMASIIALGELDVGPVPAKRPIYVRPILRPDPHDTFNSRRTECTPDDVLLIDLVHRAVKRICEGDGSAQAAAPSVRVINLSVCTPGRIFDREMSPFARLIDWLSFKYRLLFIVSAGNDPRSIELDIPHGTLSTLSGPDVKSRALAALLARDVDGRMLAPAEAINALTVGALHSDGAVHATVPGRLDLFEAGRVSPISRFGHGYRRAIKPDVLMPGGRILYRERLGGLNGQTSLDGIFHPSAPGHKVAAPPLPAGGGFNLTAYSRGTSNSAALASRAAAQAYEVITDLRESGSILDAKFDAVLLKALIAHGARWGDLPDELLSLRPELTEHAKKKDYVERWLGYGPTDVAWSLECTPERATLLGVGELTDDQGLVFEAPLPPSLSGKTAWRRLTVTLASLSPINPSNRMYRNARLWLTTPNELLRVHRHNSVHDKSAQRGTLQHEIFEGDDALAFVDGDAFHCKVNCAADAGKLTAAVSFALCVTLEVKAEANIPVYQEIKDRIRPAVRVQPGAV